MFATRECIEEMYELESISVLYGLERAHFLFLYRVAEGHNMSAIADELDKNERTLYTWRQLITKKFKANSFYQVMYELGKHFG